jgi:hypothetical protein
MHFKCDLLWPFGNTREGSRPIRRLIVSTSAQTDNSLPRCFSPAMLAQAHPRSSPVRVDEIDASGF